MTTPAPRPAAAPPRRTASHRGAALAAAVLVGCATAPAAAPPQAAPADPDAFRNAIPVTQPGPPLHAPVPVQQVLGNGLTVLTVPKHGLPLVTVSAIVKSGAAQDGAGLAGLAGFAAEMLKSGTRSRSAAAIDDAVEGRGTAIDVDVDEDAVALSVTALRDNVGPVFEVLADMLQHPSFAPEEVERLRKQRAAALAQQNDQPGHAAARAMRHQLYGDHPYGHLPLGDAAANARIDRRALQAFAAAHLRPANAAVVVVGDLEPAAAVAMVEAQLGGWRGAPGTQAPPPPPQERAAAVVLVPRPGAPQSQVVLGELGVARSDPDHFPLVMCNAILGGLFNSRINMNLREDKGYTYGARSSFDFMRQRGPFAIASGIRTDATGVAILEIFKEVEGIRGADVRAEELQGAKSRYALSLPGYFQTVDAVAEMVGSLFVYDQPLDYFQAVPEHVNAVTVADVRRVAQGHLHPERLSVVVVGDRDKVEPALTGLNRGPVVADTAP